MRPPWDQPHSPSPQKLRGGQGRPWVLVDPPVLGPQALPVAETSVLRQQRWATGAPGAEPVMGVLKCLSTLQPHSTPEPRTFSPAPSPTSTCGGMASEKNSPTRGRGAGEDQ